MKPSFTDLPIEVQQTFGNGCTGVLDFCFTASCRQHDFSFTRAGGLYDFLKANWDFYTHMLDDASKSYHYIVATVYFIGVNLIGWVKFPWTAWWRGNYRTIDEIIQIDKEDKMSWYN